MSERTGIAWADSTFNPWLGCTKISDGCTGCYAAVSTPARTLGVKWGAGQPRRRTSEANWRQPLAWNKAPFVECMACGWRGEARKAKVTAYPEGFYPPVPMMKACPSCGEPALLEARRRVFCGSLCDVFDNAVPPEWRYGLFDLIDRTPRLTWMLLTKRIGIVQQMWPWPLPPNVWIGATVVNQEEADRDIPKLLAVRATVRFLSIEPMLESIDLRDPPNDIGEPRLNWLTGIEAIDGPHIDWIIVGGESDQPGHKARPFKIAWARDIVRQCKVAGVPCFVKQLGSLPFERRVDNDGGWFLSVHDPCRIELRDRAGADPSEWPEDLRVRELPR